MAKTVRLNNATIRRIKKSLLRPLKQSKDLMRIIALELDTGTQLQFRTEGEYRGKPWASFSPETLQSSGGKYRKRPGTDGSTRRRYSASSKLLQASGGFRRSFRTMSIGNKKVRYGSNFTSVEPEYIIGDRLIFPDDDISAGERRIIAKRTDKFFKERIKY